ncbi:MAG: helix-turn-helix domain-containing protein [Cohnella sp.]|nr:helix-turn-helix domain-containing protein [Cohnella sp.]
MNPNEALMGQKIRRLRKRLGWTQEELAYRAQIDASYLGQIERGERRSPTVRIIGKIADALSVDSSVLLQRVEAEPADDDNDSIEPANIPERIALELGGVSRGEQLVYYRIFKLLRNLNP